VKVRGQRDLVTVVGQAASISAGEWVQMSGTWTNDRTHGLQFKANFLKASPPTTLEGIERYLGSGTISGIGPIYAKRLVTAFGEMVFDLIEQQPDRLREVTGIGPKRAARIIAGWAEQKVIREIMLFLHTNGVSTSRAVRIYKTYEVHAVHLISENPCRLAREIRGIGFVSAGRIAEKLGIEKTAMIRVRAGIGYALGKAMEEGHCGLPVTQLLRLTADLIEVPPALIESAPYFGAGGRRHRSRHSRRTELACSWRDSIMPSKSSRGGCGRSPGAHHPGPRSTMSGRSPGGTADVPYSGRERERGSEACGQLRGPGGHRRARCTQDHSRSIHSPRKAGGSMGTDRARCKALVGEHGASSAYHPPLAGGGPKNKQL
jgi:DNA-binding Lrp family transcriptional regulator